MTRPWLGSLAGVITGVLACAVDTSGVGDGSGDTADTGSSTGASGDPTTTATSSASADATSTDAGDTGPADTAPADTGPADTGPADTGSGGSEATTDPDTSTTGTDGTDEGSSSGELPDDSYPSCAVDADCEAPYTLCWPPAELGTPNFCTHECIDADDCPVPNSGAATPVCEGPPGTDICVLDCSDGDCPTGMTCTDVFGDGFFLRCTRE